MAASSRARTALAPSLPLFLVLLALTFAASLQPRVRQYREWTAEPTRYFAGSVPVASADSYYHFRMARMHRDGDVELAGRDPLRDHPDGTDFELATPLSWAMAQLSRFLDGDVYRAGIFLTIALSSLFVLPLGLYGWVVGQPAAGLLGALVGSFSPAYFWRTGIDRVDTDSGNQFCVWLIACCFALVSPAASPRRNFGFAAASGLSVSLFCWWYEQLAFLLVYTATFALVLAVGGFRGRRALLLFGTFLLFANPLNAAGALENIRHLSSEYVFPPSTVSLGSPSSSGTNLEFPNLTADIQEFSLLPWWRTLANVVRIPALSLVGLVGFGVWVLLRFRAAIPLLPIVAIASLAFFRSNRYAMYLSPLVGIGWGYWIALGVSGLARLAARASATGSDRFRGRLPELATYAIALGGVALLLEYTAYDRSPRPHVSARLIASLQRLKPVLPPESAVWHSWSYGYLVTDVTDHATFNDGEFPDPVVEQLLARGLTGTEPAELFEIASFVANRGRAGLRSLLEDVDSYAAFLEKIEATRAPLDAPVVLLLTSRMVREFHVYFGYGHWNFETLSGPGETYSLDRCRKIDAQRLSCAVRGEPDALVDLAKGTISGQPVVAKYLRLRAGRVIEEVDYAHEGGFYVQLMEQEGAEVFTVHVMRGPVFHSNFNQMFMLGRFDEHLFSEIYNDAPVARAFRLTGNVAQVRDREGD